MKYGLHKGTGQARTIVNGQPVYLGKYGSKESKEAYQRLLDGVPVNAPCTTVGDVLLAYWAHAQTYYRLADGSPSKSQLARINIALHLCRVAYGNELVESFGPRAFRDVRDAGVAKGWSRNYVNVVMGCLRRAFKWGVSHELCPASIYEALRTVEGLKKGRTTAKERAPVRPVPIGDVKACLPFMSRAIAAMVKLQLYTGMRPGEVVLMRGRDIRREGRVWTFHPVRHKGQWRAGERIIYLGPRAQRIVQQFEGDDFLFRPADAPNRKRHHVGERYTSDTYRQAISYGWRKANRAAALNRQAAIPHWHPNQLRHTAATRFRRKYGIELARILLGHSTAFTTEIYAEADVAKAKKAMHKLG